MQDDAPMPEDPIFAAIRELQTLSRIPMPLFRSPPWEAIRAALPASITLPQHPIQVLVDLDIDVTGTVIRAAVGHIPESVAGQRVVAASVGRDGSVTMQPRLDAASPELAHAVATGLLGAKFTPGERDGHAVPVRQFRMSVEVLPTNLQSGATL